MYFKSGIKFLFVFVAFIALNFLFSLKSVASDYQYKILDPKYNPAAEQLVNGNLAQVNEIKKTKEHTNFDFVRFFAILASIYLPILVISLITKTFKKISQEMSAGTISQYKTSKDLEENITTTTEFIENTEFKNITEEKEEIINNNDVEIQQFKTAKVTNPININNAKILSTFPLTANKGFCVVVDNNKTSLLGFVNNQNFVINELNSLKKNNLRAKYTETIENKDRYIVRVDDYKALVEVDEEKINLILEL